MILFSNFQQVFKYFYCNEIVTKLQIHLKSYRFFLLCCFGEAT